ncbi:MAG: DUF367 family protein [Thaumarchaeota archaeon]|nr:DUF367 family protein [Nitrososphaerota archaeon]MCY3976060.1 DUF367 family protein [Nitrososphaerota archaeon]
MKIKLVMFKEDDPRKCTAIKLIRFKLANKTKKTNYRSLILDPFAKKILSPVDKHVKSITAIDCSWNKINPVSIKRFIGMHRKLPPLYAGNPVNYSKLNKLTTVEAIAAALFILGDVKNGKIIMSKFKWGHSFIELNYNLLNDYSKSKSPKEINDIVNEYGIIV